MSLFEDDRYAWRETYFVLFPESTRPTAKQVEAALRKVGDEIEISNLRADQDGRLEMLTLTSPDDYAAMDISYVSGEEVREQVVELTTEMQDGPLTAEEKQKLKRLRDCDARFDVYHFEQVVIDAPRLEGDEEEFLDPGALLIVLDHLAEACQGVGVDPQSGSFV